MTLQRLTSRLMMILIVLNSIAIVVLFVRFDTEASTRRVENCKLFVGNWRADVRQVTQTVDYLQSLRPEETGNTLNKRVAANLPMTINRVKVNTPPNYCNVSKRETAKVKADLLLAAGFVRSHPAP